MFYFIINHFVYVIVLQQRPRPFIKWRNDDIVDFASHFLNTCFVKRVEHLPGFVILNIRHQLR